VADETPDLLTLALARFKLAASAESEQRKREIDDLKFVDFDEQWPEDVKASRNGYQPGGGLPVVPARPCLTINKLLQPVEQIVNQARQARLAIQFAPKGNGASQDVAEAYEDIVRAIQADSRAHLARQWAFERTAKCGRGFYRILTEYANDGDNDLDIVYRRILNQSSVYLDPAAQEPDWSDGRWAFVTDDMPLAQYKTRFPKSKLTTFDQGELTGIGNDCPGWVTSTEDGQVVRVAEYWRVEAEKVRVTLYILPDGTEKNLADDDEVPEGAQPAISPAGALIQREVSRPKVKWCLINAIEELESRDWPGRYIPIIPVLGREANINGERRFTGVVRPAMDAQRSYNFMTSAAVEAIGLAPRAPWVAYAETLEGYESWWNQANTRNFPYLPIKAARDASGAVLPPPQRSVLEPAIQAITLARQQADTDIKGTTGVFDPSLGNLSPSERSGKAILALQKQSEQGTGVYLDNLAQMSMLYEGKILKDLIPKVYSRKGRVVPGVGEDDNRRQMMIGQPFKVQNGQPVASNEQDAETIDLAAGEYAVAVTIGKSFTTRREEGVSQMGELAQAVPNLVPTYADLWVGNMDFPGARQIADRLKKTLPPGLAETDDGGPSPEQLQQQLQQAGQMMEMMTKELEAKNRIIETDEVKAQRDFAVKKMESEAEALRAAAEIEAKQAIEFRKLEVQLEIEMAKLGSAQSMARAELEQQELHAHSERELAKEQMGLDVAKQSMAQQAERDEAEAARGFEADQGERGRQRRSRPSAR
jgi:hypothetical protein